MLCLIIHDVSVLSRVESGFTFPAGNISERVQALLNNYTSVHEKLHELRSLMNSATATANNASTTNAVNRRNLAHEVAQIRGTATLILDTTHVFITGQ